jgi:hypothetical protein
VRPPSRPCATWRGCPIVIQRRLGIDLGLGLGQPLPPIHSRQAAEITRRVMGWAAHYDADDEANLDDSRPTSRQFAV